MFHKILKSGCKAEESKLRTRSTPRQSNLGLLHRSWRVFWMTMLNRSTPSAQPDLALTGAEIRLLDHPVKDKDTKLLKQKTLSCLPEEKSLGSAVILPAPAILLPAIPSCGADCHVSLISK
jgi:hypothetical protein